MVQLSWYVVAAGHRGLESSEPKPSTPNSEPTHGEAEDGSICKEYDVKLVLAVLAPANVSAWLRV